MHAPKLRTLCAVLLPSPYGNSCLPQNSKGTRALSVLSEESGGRLIFQTVKVRPLVPYRILTRSVSACVLDRVTQGLGEGRQELCAIRPRHYMAVVDHGVVRLVLDDMIGRFTNDTQHLGESLRIALER